MSGRYDMVVLGGGAGGMAAARTAVRLHRRVALVQDGPIGGDCTFTGCVPSKSFIEAIRRGRGVADALGWAREVVSRIAETESAEVLRAEGIDVVEGNGVLEGAESVRVGEVQLEARRIVVATGSAPAIPAIPGLADIPYLTNETFFDLIDAPASLGVLGAGPVGCELSQALASAGVRVVLLESADRVLPREEPTASAVILRALRASGVEVHLGITVDALERVGNGRVSISYGDSVVEVDRLLLASGRYPRTAGIGLEAAGVALDRRGYITVDPYLRTSTRGVFAVGDVTGSLALTHVADEMGRIAARNALLPFVRRSFDAGRIPWVTFTQPELARIGILETEGALRGDRIATVELSHVDRAIAADRMDGFVTLIAGRRRIIGRLGGGRVVGATVVADRAGEMVNEIAVAVTTRMFVGRLAQTVHAYPTWSNPIRAAAAQFYFEIDGRRAVPCRREG